MDVLEWLNSNIISILLPVVSAFLAWFFSRTREKSEVSKNIAETEKMEAEEAKIRAETNQIAISASNMAVSQWSQLYDRIQAENALVRADVARLEKELESFKHTVEVYTGVVNYLLTEMDKYNSDISDTARRMLKEGWRNDG